MQFKDLKLVGLKSHDCHKLMQQLLVVAIRDILPNKVIDPLKLYELKNEAAIILC